MNPNHVNAIKAAASLPTDLQLGLIYPALSLSHFVLPTVSGFNFADTLVSADAPFEVPSLSDPNYDEIVVLGHRVYIEGSDTVSLRIYQFTTHESTHPTAPYPATCRRTALLEHGAQRTIIVPRFVYELYALCRKGDAYTIRKYTSPSAQCGCSLGAPFSLTTPALPTLHTTRRAILRMRAYGSRTTTVTRAHDKCGNPDTVSLTVNIDATRDLISVPIPAAIGSLATVNGLSIIRTEVYPTLAKATIQRPNAYLEAGRMIGRSK